MTFRRRALMTWPTAAHDRARWGFYAYAFACEVFSCVAVAVFLPVFLEQLARTHGFVDGDAGRPCLEPGAGAGAGETVHCSVRLGWLWVDTTSFSLFIKSASVAVQAVTVISISVLADVAAWRKRLLGLFALIGSTSAALFLVLPTGSTHSSVMLALAALLAISSVACFGDSFVCLNAFLPGVVAGAPEVVRARQRAYGNGGVEDNREEADTDAAAAMDEQQALMSRVIERTASLDLARSITSLPPDADPPTDAVTAYHLAASRATARISSIGVGLGYCSGVSVLALTIIPVARLGGSLFSLRLAIGGSGVWWALFTLPALVWLPGEELGGDRPRIDVVDKLKDGWRRLGGMMHASEIRRLRVTYWYLLAWALLSDAFNTTTSLAVLFGSTVLGMPSSRVILIGILTQSTAIISALGTPRFQRWSGASNRAMLVGCVGAVMLMCAYVLLGLVGGWTVGGLRTNGEMYVCAVWFGLVFGPFNALSRAIFSEIIPKGHEARFFSLFSITDKSASFLGPAVVGIIADRTGEMRYGFAFLLCLLALPIPVLLWKVDMDAGIVDARRYSEEESGKVNLDEE